jgi:hypothetical protein
MIGLASLVLTVTGFCIRGMHGSSHLHNETDNVALPSSGTIEAGSVAKFDEQSCWRPGLTRNTGIAELSCDFWQRLIDRRGTP